jgi:hypothetical protein
MPQDALMMADPLQASYDRVAAHYTAHRIA